MTLFQDGDGTPEKIGALLGAALTAVVYAGIAWMMLTAAGL